MSVKLRLMALYFAEKKAAGQPPALQPPALQPPPPSKVVSSPGRAEIGQDTRLTARGARWLKKAARVAAGTQAEAPAQGRKFTATAGQIGPPLLVVVIAIWAAGLVAGFNTALWLLILLGFLLSVAGLRFPVAGLFGIAILVAIEPVTQVYLPDTGFYRWNTLIYWLLIVMALNIPTLLRLNDLNTRLLEVFVLLVALEIAFSNLLTKGVQNLLEILTVFGLLIYALRVMGEKKVYYWLALILGALGGMGGLVFNLLSNSLPYLNPNAWAFFPATALFAICLGVFELSREEPQEFNRRPVFARKHSGSGSRLIVLAFLFAVNYVWIFLSGSRGNMLTGLICLVFILWQIRGRPWMVGALIIAALLGYWITTTMEGQSSYALSRIQLFFNSQEDFSRRTSGRNRLLEAGLLIFSKNPFGIGTGSFRNTYAEIDRAGHSRPSHSAWVTTLAENGIPGIVLMVLYVASFAWIGWRREKRTPGLFALGLLVSTLLGAVFVSKELNVRGLWLLVAVATVELNQERMRRILNLEDPRRILRRYAHLRGGWLLKEENVHE